MATFGTGTSGEAVYISEAFDGGLPNHVSLLLLPVTPVIVRRWGTAVIEKGDRANGAMDMASKAIWAGGVTFNFDPAIDEEATYNYHLVIYWKVPGRDFVWFAS